jgi:hypothetical protein
MKYFVRLRLPGGAEYTIYVNSHNEKHLVNPDLDIDLINSENLVRMELNLESAREIANKLYDQEHAESIMLVPA